jgi:hypothetical protein
MKKCDFTINHKEFDSWILWYGDFIKKIIEAERVIRRRNEKKELIEAIVLRAASRWEVLIEQDIVTSINHNPSAYARALNLKLRKHLTKDECKAMVFGHRFLDFKSVGDVKSFGKRYLVQADNPFAAIPGAVCNLIDEFMTMRNLLAHYSDYGWRSYYGFMKKKYRYVRVPEPGEFLITADRNGHRWVRYLKNFLEASEKMLKAVT